MASITIIQDVVYNGRTKHIDVRLKSLREHVRRGAILLRHIGTKRQLADVLTKGLPEAQHNLLIRILTIGGSTEEE